MTISSDADNTMITFNDPTALSISFETGGNLKGAGAWVFCDGTRWYGIPLCKHTMTVA